MLKRALHGMVASIAIGYSPTLVAQIEIDQGHNEATDPYVLCEDYPLNSICQPHHVSPMALADRPGEMALGCLLTVDDTQLQGRCKHLIEADRVVAYIEEGPKLAALEDYQPTRRVEIPISDILKLMYEEATAEQQASLLNFLEILPPVRIVSNLFRRSEEISLVSVAFADATDIESAPLVLTLLVSQDKGAELRSQFETFTGLPSEAPPAGR
ncbi:MAG: hypothetical protein ACFBSG_06075 [Leptolyngbyaceae cyanobacterium]